VKKNNRKAGSIEPAFFIAQSLKVITQIYS